MPLGREQYTLHDMGVLTRTPDTGYTLWAWY